MPYRIILFTFEWFQSSLLNAILGVLPLAVGNIQRSGNIAYLPQTPWIIPATVRENIICGLPFIKSVYDEVLRVTALDVV